VTLNDPMTVITCYFSLYGKFRDQCWRYIYARTARDKNVAKGF